MKTLPLATFDLGQSPAAGAKAVNETRDARSRSARSARSARESGRARESAHALEDLQVNWMRLRRAASLGSFIWMCFGIADFFVVSYIHPGLASWLYSLRIIGGAIVGSLALAVRLRPPQTTFGLLVYDCSFFATGATLISLMCVKFDGLRSVYAAGIPVVLICRSAFAAMPWRTALLSNSLAASAYPLVLLGSAAFVPAVREQLADPVSLIHFGLYLAFIVSTFAFSLAGGHYAWSLRQQLFEARSIGRHQLLQRIGEGGMGEVWSALHPGLKRKVAMKILHPLRRTDPIALRRFEREVRAMSELNHPNIVRIFDYGVTNDGLWFYTMELLSGEDLSRVVSRSGALSIERAVGLLSQAASALGQAHSRGIVHRDVKPENLFITSGSGQLEFVKVLDFGIARVMGDDAQTGITTEGWIGGTPAYMSPEVVAGLTADSRSDVYALSAVLYFAISGCHPFEGASVATMLVAHLQLEPEPPSTKLGKPLPPALEAFILKNLAKEPADRCSDANEFARELASLDKVSWSV